MNDCAEHQKAKFPDGTRVLANMRVRSSIPVECILPDDGIITLEVDTLPLIGEVYKTRLPTTDGGYTRAVLRRQEVEECVVYKE